MKTLFGTQYLLPTKRQKEYTISVIIGVIVNLILNFILINLWQSIGASIATILSQIVVDGVQIHFVRKDIRWKPLIRIAVRYLVASFIMFGACSLVKAFISTGVLSIILQMGIGVVVYILMLIWFKDKFLNLIIQRIKAKLMGFKAKLRPEEN